MSEPGSSDSAGAFDGRLNFRLDGKVALLTGAGRGIGRAMAHTLAAHGAAVAIQDIELPVAQAEADAIVARGGRAIALGGDATDVSIAQSLVDQTRERLGGIHILINNAAIQVAKPFTDLTVDEMDRQLRANFELPILLCAKVCPLLAEQRWGRVINLGSIQGRNGNAHMLAYSMSKAAIHNLTLAIAKRYGSDGVTCNTISPGYILNTWRNRHETVSPEEEKKDWFRKMIPLARTGRPEDCAGLTLLLCSEAGSYITGQNIYVDGGMSTH
jgi:NAD(P)-dependent dehydrogenase (short-subunit alcohol dehydrogenase family)